jgi:hypothetical protein
MDDLAVDTAIFRLRHFRKGGVQVNRYPKGQVDGGVFHTTSITNLTPDAQARIMVSEQVQEEKNGGTHGSIRANPPGVCSPGTQRIAGRQGPLPAVHGALSCP